MKIIMDIVNNVVYKDAKIYYEVIYIVGYINFSLNLYYSSLIRMYLLLKCV
jgi:hypothetical protein